MIFLVHYDRVSQRLVSLQEFPDSDMKRVSELRIEMEIEMLSNGLHQEVVLLEAASKGDLMESHRRYFMTLDELKSNDGGIQRSEPPRKK